MSNLHAKILQILVSRKRNAVEPNWPYDHMTFDDLSNKAEAPAIDFCAAFCDLVRAGVVDVERAWVRLSASAQIAADDALKLDKLTQMMSRLGIREHEEDDGE